MSQATAPRAATRAGGDLHLVQRFTYGHTPDLMERVRRAGGGAAWLRSQLEQPVGPDPADEFSTWWPGLAQSPSQLWTASRNKEQGGGEVMAAYQNYLLLRRIHTERQVLEVMTELWENHFNVPVKEDRVFTWRRDYGDRIRALALTSFAELLSTAITHPAMLLYLDGAVNEKDAPNENLGRELLELHTVGLGTYGEDDVKAATRVLTGWSVDLRTFAAEYKPNTHATGRVKVLDFEHPNEDPDGREVTAALLAHLARHPATARRVVRMIAVRFVSDEPSPALLDDLVATYVEHDTAIAPLLLHLVETDEFQRSEGGKVRDPAQDLVATYRVLGPRFVRPPDGPDGRRFAANMLNYQSSTLGAAPGSWPQPDGQPLDNQSWASPARMVASLRMHWYVSAGYFPRQGITYRRPADWLPGPRLPFDDLVDHLSQQLLGRSASRQLVSAASTACQVGSRDTITRKHPLVRHHMHRLLCTVLDTPEHMTR